jgi:ABC-type uncharacterized transport system ATPase subunit
MSERSPALDGSATPSPSAAIASDGLWKTYGSVTANCDVSIAVRPGTVHAVLGENGAGKSTLMKMLYGVEQPDRGAILVAGRRVTIDSPKQAIAMGIGMVFQHFGLVPGLTAAENVVLGVEPTKAMSIDRGQLRTGVTEVMDRFDLRVELDDKVGQMSAARQQRVEILKALYRGARIIILDEPTALLTPQERARLFEAIRHLTGQGATVLFISHKLAEVEEIADEVTVMRAGQVVGGGPRADFDRHTLVGMMVGDATVESRRAATGRGLAVCRVQGLRVRGRSGQESVRDVSLEVHAGEVLGLAGVEGNGQLECLEALAGLRLPLAGTLEVGGAAIARLTNRDVRRAGVAYVPEDRLAAGLAAEASIVDNLLANRLGSGGFTRRGVLRRGAMRKEAGELVARFGVRCGSIDQAAGGLSGGNMQKVILAREISVAPKVLLVAEPTRGLDVAAIALVHEQLAQAAEAGTGVVVLSSDIDELLSICTRILVFREGRIVADFGDVESLTAQQMGAAMLGVDGERLAQVPA